MVCGEPLSRNRQLFGIILRLIIERAVARAAGHRHLQAAESHTIVSRLGGYLNK